MALEEAIFGGGCFWCIDAAFRQLDGVVDTLCAYANGKLEKPDYKAVCTDTTGHAEVVKIIYDDTKLSYRELLEVFYSVHDPCTLNRQGADYGSQYRSTILWQREEERLIAEEVTAETEKSLGRKIVTKIEALRCLYPAEEYHQNYFSKNPNHGYCRAVVAPKAAKVRALFPGKVRKER
jgi:peptide-methionine (S)-S-oxide reductase